ncbi:kinase-like domain, phloem protein 2-like protein [Tanacetum coccineum]|uniref:Kinase-like domain, phloem protein 2-like protein n=1 Tax=Tanacetum coccineum TaxID=301880 RepID=A0ABQ5GXT1_9ASTR
MKISKGDNERVLNVESLKRELQISLENIRVATQEFSQEYCVGSGRDWKLYKGDFSHAKANVNATGCTTIVAKQWIQKYGQENNQFRTELDVLFNRKHEDIISLAGYCDEQGETIIVYKHVWNGSLDEHLNNVNLTWIKRLQICINIASGLEFLHGGGVTQKKLVHGNIKSANILLTADWKAKISNFEFSSLDSLHQHIDHVSDHAYGTFAYLDPKLAWGNGCEDHSQSLGPSAKKRFKEGKFNEMAREMVIQLKEALEFQEDKEIWEPMLPRNYREIIDMSKTPGIYSINKKKDLYRMLSDAVFLQGGKVWFSLSKTGKGNAMISATMFSYENRTSHKWRYIQRSRFHRVAKMMDMTNLKIQIKIKTEILSKDIVYGVHLVFKFCDPGKVYSNPIYVNLKYKMGSETSHAYFAKHRDDDGWMMIELCRFLNQKEVTVFEVSLESFSRYYCGSGAIYMKQEDLGETVKGFNGLRCGIHSHPYLNAFWSNIFAGCKKLLLPKKNVKGFEHDPDGNKTSMQSEVNGKKHLMISATKVLFNSRKMKFFHPKPSAESR